MSCDYNELTHAGIKTLYPYKPGKSVEELMREQGISDIVKLASNENPLGCSPHVRQTLANLSGQYIATYPTPVLHPLMDELSEHLGIHRDQLTLANGSDCLYSLLMTLFALHQNKSILTHDKAFITYQVQAQTLGLPIYSSPLDENWQVDIDALIAACRPDTALIFLANPNNPTGVLIAQHDIKRLLDAIPQSTLLVLDEAYYEFAYPHTDRAALALLADYPNLVVTRTFSKIYGLAGMRLGYAMAHPVISDLLKRIQLPFTVNQVVMAAARAALQDQDFVRETLAVNAESKQIMAQGLQDLGLDFIPSACNFITFDCAQAAMPVYEKLLQHGLIVRPLGVYNMPQHLRVSIGTTEHSQRFLATLPDCLKP